jgi:hypothetical protein
VVLNGWLEHFSPQELRDNYGVLRNGTPDLRAALRRLDAGAVIAHVPSAIRALQAAGFKPVYETPQGTYLVRAPTMRTGDGVHSRIR